MDEDDVRRIVEEVVARKMDEALAKLRISGSGVSGDYRSGWAVNGGIATATCNDDGTITITWS